MIRIFNKFKINFMVVGAQKAGTSALDYYLRQHPTIKMGLKKELHFFDNDLHFKKRNVDYSPLKKYYPERDNKYIYGEVTPSYVFWKGAMERIKKYNKKMMLIAILRNPIDRAFSSWNMEVKRGNEHRSFRQSIDEEINDILKGNKKNSLLGTYVSRGLYFEQITNMKKLFPQNQILFIRYEDYMVNQKTVLRDVFSFLKVKEYQNNIELKSVHKINYDNEMTGEERKILIDFYKEDISRVENKLNWDCSDWYM